MNQLNRRGFLAFAGGATAAMALAACSSDKTTAASGSASATAAGPITLEMLNYAGWMGANVVDNYTAENPNVSLNQSDLPSGGSGGLITLLRQNASAYDFGLVGCLTAGTLEEAGVLAEFSETDVPNISLIDEQYRTAYPWGLPLENGKVGMIYRSDVVDAPTSWADLFDALPDLSGRVAFPDYDVDVFSMALLAMGEDINTTDVSKIEEAAALIKANKQYLKAFLSSGAISALSDGSVDIAVGYDYETAGVLGVDTTIGWGAPTDGMPAYLDGWTIFADSANKSAVLDFMNYQMEPENYADFINNTGAAYLSSQVDDLISEDVKGNEALAYNADNKVFYELYTNGEINAKRAELWEEIKAA